MRISDRARTTKGRPELAIVLWGLLVLWAGCFGTYPLSASLWWAGGTDVLLGLGVVILVWRLRRRPGMRSFADLGLRQQVPISRLAGLLVFTASTSGYIAVMWIADVVTSMISPITGWPGQSTAPTDTLTSGILGSVCAGLGEEIVWLALPIAVGALAWRTVTAGLWGLPVSVRVQRVLILVGTGFVVIGARLAGHAWRAFPADVFSVVPWMLGAVLIFSIAGTIWPLVVGHALWDIYSFSTPPDWVGTAFTYVVLVGVCVIFATPFLLAARPSTLQMMWRTPDLVAE